MNKKVLVVEGELNLNKYKIITPEQLNAGLTVVHTFDLEGVIPVIKPQALILALDKQLYSYSILDEYNNPTGWFICDLKVILDGYDKVLRRKSTTKLNQFNFQRARRSWSVSSYEQLHKQQKSAKRFSNPDSIITRSNSPKQFTKRFEYEPQDDLDRFVEKALELPDEDNSNGQFLIRSRSGSTIGEMIPDFLSKEPFYSEKLSESDVDNHLDQSDGEILSNSDSLEDSHAQLNNNKLKPTERTVLLQELEGEINLNRNRYRSRYRRRTIYYALSITIILVLILFSLWYVIWIVEGKIHPF